MHISHCIALKGRSDFLLILAKDYFFLMLLKERLGFPQIITIDLFFQTAELCQLYLYITDMYESSSRQRQIKACESHRSYHFCKRSSGENEATINCT